MKNFIKKIDWYYIFLLVLTVFGCHFFIRHIFHILYDVGRELYLPAQILDNKILYKDIFNIFGPFSYLFNASLLKFFKIDITTLFVLGYFTSILTISGIYHLGKILINKKIAFLIALFSILLGVTTINNLNYTLPYSYGVLYGFIAFLWSIYYFIKSYKNNFNLGYIYLSVFLSGIAVCNKYEFYLYSIFLLLCVFRYIKNKIHIPGILFTFCLPSIICFSVLFYQGLTLHDIVNAAYLLSKYASTSSCTYFYTIVGTFFSFNNIYLIIKSFLAVFISIMLFLWGKKLINSNKIVGQSILLFSFITFIVSTLAIGLNDIFSFIPITLLIWFIYSFKKFVDIEKFVIISAFLVSIKILWNCDIIFYGTYFAPILLVGLFILLKKYEQIYKPFVMFFLILIVLIFINDIDTRKIAGFDIKINNRNKIYSYLDYSYKTNMLKKYFKSNSTPDDKVIFYPEGLLFNYIIDRPTELKYYSLLPPYWQMNEKKILKYYENNKPEFFVIIQDKGNLKLYGYKEFCKDYAVDFCNFVKNNYTLEKTLYFLDNDEEPFYIYKRK